MYAYNSRFWMESVNGGAFAIDPSFGLGLGQGNPFVVSDDGIIVPKCIDPQTGELKLDKDGFPVGMNFWAGMDGQVYVRGNIYATDGVFNGIVKAKDFQLPSGDSMVSILNDNKKIKSDWLDLMGINIKNDAGQTVMTIDQTGVKFGAGFSPVTYQYSVDGTSGWHYTMTANDKYRRESYDGGGTWADGYQFKGEDGKKGSDANVTRANIEKALQKASTTSESYIGVDSVGSPEIYGGAIYGTNIYAGDGSGSYAHMSGENFSLFAGGISEPKIKMDIGYNGAEPSIYLGAGDGTGNRVFRIYKNTTQGIISYHGSGKNYCMLLFNDDGSISPFGSTVMSGTWDFSDATVLGVHVTLA